MRAKRTDKRHADVLKAIRAIGMRCKSLHAHGEGIEDIIVALPSRMVHAVHRPHDVPVPGSPCVPISVFMPPAWVLVEVKTSRNKKGTVTESQYTNEQLEWYAETKGWPRLIVTGPQDAVDQLRAL